MDPQTPDDAADAPDDTPDDARYDTRYDVDGPPTPPPVRRRRRRRRLVLIAAGAVVVIGLPIGLAAAGVFAGAETSSATGTDTDDAEADRSEPGVRSDRGSGPDGEADGEADDGEADDGEAPDGDAGTDAPAVTPEPPDLETLTGVDAVYGRLLVDIDASERVMTTFQDEIAAVFAVPATTPEQLVEALQELGAAGRDDLREARDRLDDPLDEAGAEEIRIRYVAHLDSWADYMGAVSEDPSVLGGEGGGAGFNVVINATADAFARALEEQLPSDTDDAVRDYADAILDRGFRGSAEATV